MPAFLAGRARSFRFAIRGLGFMLRTQPNARIHAAAAAVVLLLATILRLPPDDWCWLILAITIVVTTEALNTALEFLADATCPHHHPMVGKAKDIAAAAVLLSAIGAAAIGGVIFLPRVLGMFFAIS